MSDESTAQQLVVFRLASEPYALAITRVHEIIPYTEPRSLASADPWMRGVINLRGRIVIDSIAKIGDALVVLLNPITILSAFAEAA